MEKQKMNVRRESKSSIVEPRDQKSSYKGAAFTESNQRSSQVGEQKNWKDIVNTHSNLRNDGLSNGRITSLMVKAPKNGIAGLL